MAVKLVIMFFSMVVDNLCFILFFFDLKMFNFVWVENLECFY